MPYGADRNLLLGRDISRLHALEQMHRDFVANVSHELRSPLTVIVGYTGTSRDTPDTPGTLSRLLQQMTQFACQFFPSRLEHDAVLATAAGS